MTIKLLVSQFTLKSLKTEYSLNQTAASVKCCVQAKSVRVWSEFQQSEVKTRVNASRFPRSDRTAVGREVRDVC